jgi:hypothetical protein
MSSCNFPQRTVDLAVINRRLAFSPIPGAISSSLRKRWLEGAKAITLCEPFFNWE